MKTIKLIRVGLLLSACCLTPAVHARGVDIGITVGTPAIVYAETPAPPLIVETQPVSPGVGYTWIGGSWAWGDNHKWAWEKGRWENPPHAGMHYVPHRVEEHGGKHEFHRGGWR